MQIEGRGTFVGANLDGALPGCKHGVSLCPLHARLAPPERDGYATGAHGPHAGASAARVSPGVPGGGHPLAGGSAASGRDRRAGTGVAGVPGFWYQWARGLPLYGTRPGGAHRGASYPCPGRKASKHAGKGAVG